MKRLCLAVLAAALVLPWGNLQAAGGLKTKAMLVADVKSVQPGKPFTAGLLLTMAPGWHTYWKNPGESGLATTIAWTLPKGFHAGDIVWPLPEKKVESGDVLTYGYEGETMLLVAITPSSTIPVGSRMTLKAQVDWLECEASCVPGSAMVDLTLPVSSAPAGPANEKLFAKYREQLPKPVDSNPDLAIEHSLTGRAVRLKVSPVNGKSIHSVGSLDFYPESLDGYTFGRTATEVSDRAVTITLPFTSNQDSPPSSTLRGVLVRVGMEGHRSGVIVEVPMQGTPPSGGGASSLLDRTFQIGQGGGGEHPISFYLFFAVVGGLLLNVMPCVLPVIALKVFGLVRLAGDHPAQIKKLGWFFSLGILASFLCLALLVVLLKVAGQQVGWGFQFQEPLFVIAMSAVVFAFGLSLFGVFEIRPPAAAVSGVSNVLEAKTSAGIGYSASFWEGVFATILATPCTAPFLGTALGFAFSQPWWTILLIFSAVGFGMSLPYLILTSKLAWMKYLPKPGAWMETVKQFMGFFMMATLLWLLYVLGKQLGMEALVWTGAFLLTVAVACWLVGRFATLTVSRARYFATWAVAVILVAGGYLWFVEGILNVRGLIAGTPSAGPVAEAREGIAWEPFSLQGLESRLKEKKPVFLDFTAEWCLTCKVNERAVLADQSVVDRIRSSGFIAIRADWTNRNPDITRLLQKFGRSGVPLYVIFPADNPSRPIILPELITTRMLLDALDTAVGPQ
jgi:thiol:disulfide interchange protein DsbD